MYNIISEKFVEIAIAVEAKPKARRKHSMLVIGKSVFIFGGFQG